MATNLNSLVREAITELLTSNPSLAERLAQAIAPKARKGKKLVYMVDHSENCYCIQCSQTRRIVGAVQHGLMCAAGVVETGWSARKAFAAYRAESREEAARRLALCSCGHPAEAHHEDEMNNLLQCGAHIEALGEDCKCDHFNYRIAEAA